MKVASFSRRSSACRLTLAVGVVAVAVLGASCSTNPVEVPPELPRTPTLPELPQDNQTTVGTVQPTEPDSSISISSVPNTGLTRDSIKDPESPLARRIIFFGYDSTDIAPEYMEILNNHADYLARYSDIRVRLEGHTDERGSREYNIALGDSRARSVSQILQLQGVDPGQFSTLSYGEEVPLDEGHSERSYRRNRRVEIVYEGTI